MSDRVLVAGIGNVFLGDDAFGVEVVRELCGEVLPDGVQVRDFGIRGMDLAHALLKPWEHVLLVDAVPRGGPPGTLYLFAPSLAAGHGLPAAAAGAMSGVEARTMDPFRVLELAAAMGAPRHAMHLLGCEPAAVPVRGEGGAAQREKQDGLSAAVRQAVPAAVARVKRLVEDYLAMPKCGDVSIS